MILPLDGPATQAVVSVTTSTVVEAKVGGSALDERQVLTIQPLDSKIYVYFGDGTTPTAGTVSSNGIVVFKSQMTTFEAGESQAVWLLAVSSTTDVSIAERS